MLSACFFIITDYAGFLKTSVRKTLRLLTEVWFLYKPDAVPFAEPTMSCSEISNRIYCRSNYCATLPSTGAAILQEKTLFMSQLFTDYVESRMTSDWRFCIVSLVTTFFCSDVWQWTVVNISCRNIAMPYLFLSLLLINKLALFADSWI